MARTMTAPDIIITSRDSDRLLHLLDLTLEAPGMREVGRLLDQELARAAVVAPEAIGPKVATMNSRVEYEDVTTGQRRCVTIVYPDQADPRAERISVVSPVGITLLGLTEGQETTWQLSDGRPRRTRLVRVVFQPEAAGRHDL